MSFLKKIFSGANKQKRSPKSANDPLRSKSSGIELTEEFQSALNMMESGTSPFFITGNAGTGKSTLLAHFRKNTKKNVVVVAPTGMAAINVRGVTIHSFFKFPPKLLQQTDIRISNDRVEVFRKLDTLVIDEISMVRADLLDAIDTSLRLHRSSRKPFGGVQVVFFGDIGQLPPVVTGREMKEYFSTVYSTPYFFSAKSLRNQNLNVFELTKVFRQSDPEFVVVLNKVRRAEPDIDDLITINERYRSPEDVSRKEQQITLTTTNRIADTINQTKLGRLSGPEFTSLATITGKAQSKNFPAEKELVLKKKAQIMMVKNNGSLWVNGTIGTVESFTENNFEVRLPTGVYEVKKEIWEVIEYKLDRKLGKVEENVVGTFEQFPVRLAWAVTIHKSQGQTFDEVCIDMGSGAFAHGQLYVALSRCRSLAGITMRTPIAFTDLCFDERVRGFIEVIRAGGPVEIQN